MQFRKLAAGTLCLLGLASFAAPAAPRHADVPPYSIKTFRLGAPDRWDYLTLDSARLYVAHGTHIDVFGRSGARLGHVAVPGANGVALVPDMNVGYAGSRLHRSVVEFDLQSFKVRQELAADADTDALLYDAASRRVFVMEGGPRTILVIDPRTHRVHSRIALHGQPEFAVVDGTGKLFVNIADTREIQRIDTRTASVDATWPIPACERPHGLSIDRVNHRLFATCINAVMLVVDAGDGRLVATLPIGVGSDGSAFDPTRHLAFSSNGGGTLTVIHEDAPDQYTVLGDIATAVFARTMTIDADTGRLYLVAAKAREIDPGATDLRKRYDVVADSAEVLMLDPGRSHLRHAIASGVD